MEYNREKQSIEKLPHGSFWYNENVIFLIIAYIDIHQKSSCLSEIFVVVDEICSSKSWRNAEEEDFALKYFLEVKAVAIRANSASVINHLVLSLFLELVIIYPWVLKQKNTLEKFIINAEMYLKPCQISTMELFGLTVSANDVYHRSLIRL